MKIFSLTSRGRAQILGSMETKTLGAPLSSEHAADSAFERFALSRRDFLTGGLVAIGLGVAGIGKAGEISAVDSVSYMKGSLFIAGGGNLSTDITDHYLKLAKGRRAKIVLIPTASEDADVEKSIAHYWKGARKELFHILHTRDREVANDPAFVEPLRNATGVWLSGGKQLLLSDPYRGTLVEKEIQGVLDRDGVVGGSSAGAAIMPSKMISGGVVLPEEGEGFNFFDGSVDQHFFERNRHLRLMNLVEKYPHLTGMGIDENTAVVVRRTATEEVIRVLGKGRVWIYRARFGENRERMKLYIAGDEFTVPRSKSQAEAIVAKTPMGESDAEQPAGTTVTMPPTP